MSTVAVDNLTDSAGTGSPNFPNKLRQDFYLSPLVITTSYVIPTNFNAMTAGPIDIATGVEVEVSAGSTWTIV
jgi:hypothetical protein